MLNVSCFCKHDTSTCRYIVLQVLVVVGAEGFEPPTLCL